MPHREVLRLTTREVGPRCPEAEKCAEAATFFHQGLHVWDSELEPTASLGDRHKTLDRVSDEVSCVRGTIAHLMQLTLFLWY